VDVGDDDRYSRPPRLEDLVAICKALNEMKARSFESLLRKTEA
jgi:hypothetical protein